MEGRIFELLRLRCEVPLAVAHEATHEIMDLVREGPLSFARRLSEMDPEDDEGRSCIFCGAYPDKHAEDCLWVAARAVFWDEDGYCLTCGGGPDDTGVAMPGKHMAGCAAGVKP